MARQHIRIQIKPQKIKISNEKEKIKTKIKQILNCLGYNKHEISVLITDNNYIKELNKAYRGIDSPTNVLSFSMFEGEFPHINNMLGDLIISAEKAGEEALKSGITFDERMSQLLVHGILHLVGYDHEDSDDKEAEMEKKSLEILRLIEPDKELVFF